MVNRRYGERLDRASNQARFAAAAWVTEARPPTTGHYWSE